MQVNRLVRILICFCCQQSINDKQTVVCRHLTESIRLDRFVLETTDISNAYFAYIIAAFIIGFRDKIVKNYLTYTKKCNNNLITMNQNCNVEIHFHIEIHTNKTSAILLY